MAKGLTRSSVMAIKEEAVEGVLETPSAATDFLAIQEGASIEPNFETLDNEELKSSIGQAKTILGFERPAASFDHYFRHSGVEGQAPNYGDLLKGVFGSENVQATERDTVAASTATVVKVDAGEGVEWTRGSAVLVKDGSNGYAIRPVHSVSTDDLNLAFPLGTAPASGVNLGKYVNYAPANSGHIPLSVHMYNANGHSVESVAGSKVIDFSMEAAAGEFLQGSYSLEGTKYFYNPIEITSTTNKMDFDDAGGEENVSVTAQVYRTPHELAAALQTAMDAATADNITVVWNDVGANAGKFTIASDGGTLSLLFATGANTAQSIAGKLGFDVVDETGSLSYSSDSEVSWAAAFTPTFDTSDPLVGKDNEVLLGDGDETVNFCANTISVGFSNTKAEVQCVTAESGIDSNFVSEREITVSLTGVVERHDADLVNRFLNNTNCRFMYAFGTKSGGNWEAGKCGVIYLPTSTVSSFVTTDLDGVVGIEVELKAYVDDLGSGEFYINFL